MWETHRRNTEKNLTYGNVLSWCGRALCSANDWHIWCEMRQNCAPAMDSRELAKAMCMYLWLCVYVLNMYLRVRQAKPSHDELVLPWKLEYFFLCLIQYWSNNVQCMMEAPWWRSAFTTQYPIIYGLSTNMTEKEKAVAKEHRGAKTWECEIHGKIYQREFVWVCVWVYSCDCERAYVQVYLEKVKSECRKITLRNQNATMMASLCWMNSIVDRWMDGWCFYLM